MKNVLFLFIVAPLVFTSTSKAQVGETIIEICSEAGCTVPEPDVALVFMILNELTNELNKPDRFGESNEIMKAIRELDKFVNKGMGPNNDLRKFLEQAGITDLLARLGIQLF